MRAVVARVYCVIIAGRAVVLPAFLFRFRMVINVMNATEQRRKKRAVYTGLQPLLSDSELVAALRLWEKKYAVQNKNSVRYFIEEVVERIEGRLSVRTLLPGVVKALYQSESDLLPYPDGLLDGSGSGGRRASVSAYEMPEMEAFRLLVTKWLQLADSVVAEDARQYVLHALPTLKLSHKLEAEIAGWLHKPDATMSHLNVTVKNLQAVINLFYMAFCASLGPVKADELLARTVDRLKNNGGAAYQTLFGKLL